MATVNATADAFVAAGTLTAEQKAAIVAAADSARAELAPEAEISVTVTPEARFLGGSAYLAVRVVNDHDAPVDVEIETAYGSKTFTGVAPGRSAFQQFAVRAAALPAGEVTITVTGTVEGGEVTTEVVEALRRQVRRLITPMTTEFGLAELWEPGTAATRTRSTHRVRAAGRPVPQIDPAGHRCSGSWPATPACSKDSSTRRSATSSRAAPPRAERGRAHRVPPAHLLDPDRPHPAARLGQQGRSPPGWSPTGSNRGSPRWPTSWSPAPATWARSTEWLTWPTLCRSTSSPSSSASPRRTARGSAPGRRPSSPPPTGTDRPPWPSPPTSTTWPPDAERPRKTTFSPNWSPWKLAATPSTATNSWRWCSSCSSPVRRPLWTSYR